MKAIAGLFYLLVFLIVGGLLQQATALPIPAPVLGMILLLGFLLIKNNIPEPLEHITQVLSPLLPLFLLPVSAGIITQSGIIKEHGIVLLIILAISIIPGALVTAFIMSVGRK